MNLLKPREITFADIELKPQSDIKKGNGADNYYAFVVPYLKGHAVAEMLDDWVTPLGWKDHYEQREDGMIVCYLSVWSPEREQWVTKEDIGANSREFSSGGAGNAQKGGISDAFKRCASRKWGVGRRIYDLKGVTAPMNGWTKPDGKIDGRVDESTYNKVRRDYQGLFPWLQGEPVIGIDDEGPGAPETPVEPSGAPGTPSPDNDRPKARRKAQGPSERRPVPAITNKPGPLFKLLDKEGRAAFIADFEGEVVEGFDVPIFPFPSKTKIDELNESEEGLGTKLEGAVSELLQDWMINRGVLAPEGES